MFPRIVETARREFSKFPRWALPASALIPVFMAKAESQWSLLYVFAVLIAGRQWTDEQDDGTWQYLFAFPLPRWSHLLCRATVGAVLLAAIVLVFDLVDLAGLDIAVHSLLPSPLFPAHGDFHAILVNGGVDIGDGVQSYNFFGPMNLLCFYFFSLGVVTCLHARARLLFPAMLLGALWFWAPITAVFQPTYESSENLAASLFLAVLDNSFRCLLLVFATIVHVRRELTR